MGPPDAITENCRRFLSLFRFPPRHPHHQSMGHPTDQMLPAARGASAAFELLAPAGDRVCLQAAVENGADAVYFGLDRGFNARARATNLSLESLPEVMQYLHARGVKGYVTFNTLVFPDELPAAEESLRAIAEAGADAVLIQDLGVMRLARAICPDLAIHASTQATMTSAETIAELADLGVQRVVLARELSIDEIRQIRQATTMPLEVFVHGALCVAYSGQCLTSESLGGRSANRGQCAQACRLPYELVCDGQDRDLGPVQYLLSPQDLAAYDLVPELIEIGVCSFKIEGRLKTPEYVANVTQHYRRVIDAALAGRKAEFTRRDIQELELSFSRGFSHGWLQGCDHKALVPGLSSAKRGIRLGRVTGFQGRRVRVRLEAPIAVGDGVVFAGNRFQGQEQGGRVVAVWVRGVKAEKPCEHGEVELEFFRESVDLRQLHIGQEVWKTDDPQLTARLRKTFTAADPIRRVPLRLTVKATVGEPLVVEATAANGARCRVATEQPLQAAQRHPLTSELLQAQLGRLGGTVYALHELAAEITGEPMVPLSVLGQLRKRMIQELDASLAAVTTRHVAPAGVLANLRKSIEASIAAEKAGRGQHASSEIEAHRLRVLCRSLSQLEVVLAEGVHDVYVDFHDIREYRQAVAIAHAGQANIFLATPRIQKPGEMGIFRALAKHGADGILVRNLSGLRFFSERSVPCVADFSLNAANELTAAWLMDRGVVRLTASYDLNRDQLLDLVSSTPAAWWEVVIHQHMPMFHMEHCVFCAVLSPGTNKTNCGRPCDRHQVALRDRIGMEHPLHADVGCRNTLFNAMPQSAAEVVPTLQARGLRDFRIELVDESAETIRHVIGLYRDLLARRVTGKEVWMQLKATNRVGVTRGTLEERRNPLAIL